MVIRLVSLAVIVIIIAVAANTMSMTARERFGEFAVLKTLGFGGWRIAGLILGESLVIAVVGRVFRHALHVPRGRRLQEPPRELFPRVSSLRPDPLS